MGESRVEETLECLLIMQSSQWKKYLTTMQITQFVIDLAVVYFGSKCFTMSYM